MKNFFFFLFSTLLVAILALPATSEATPKKRLDEATQTCRILTFYNSGWASPGSKIFKKSCKSCHYQGNDKGAPFLYSESKSMKGWNRVFLTRYPECAKNGSWSSLSMEDILQVNDYLYRNAANTYNPKDAEDCG
ncbi:MAG: cytochrome c [Proteobacteria bacterium]|nr:cytochrome c [Pseudomonadota bacterium]MBU1715874.1 cytochrome c [Pseudomonadota bacterium]